MSEPRILLAIPVHNEAEHLSRVISEVRRYIDAILIVDDGSTDATAALLAEHPVEVIRHASNRGYGRAMQSMFRWASGGFDWLITMDCDEQHEPASIPDFIAGIHADDTDVISGSRYLIDTPLDDAPPADRRNINATITDELNRRLGLNITDAFCGFKAYRVSGLNLLSLDVDGYDFPMQFWVQAVAAGLRISELPVRLIYKDLSRSFGGELDNPTHRLRHYRETLEREIARHRVDLPATALDSVVASCRGCGQRPIE